jgi:hypothetical protein
MFFYFSGFMDVKLRIEKMLEQNCRERWDIQYTMYTKYKLYTMEQEYGKKTKLFYYC